MSADILGPVLVLDDVRDGRLHLSALVVASASAPLPELRTGDTAWPFRPLAHVGARAVHRARFELPADRPATYHALGTDYPVASDMTGDLAIAYASCNGEETGDLDRDEAERNVMWDRMRAAHDARPFRLLLHGGDQIYADETTKGHPLSHRWPDRLPKDPDPRDLDTLRTHLRERFFERYVSQLRSPAYAWLAARVPALAQWDDHDICDGWGSLPRSRTYSPVGQCLFDVAREMALLFQHGTVEGDLPRRFHDPEGYHLGWSVDLPDLRLVAPDLRSERTRRRIMGPGGWAMMEEIAARPAPERTLLLSSVPLLGPRLSILEALMIVIPKMQQYEDDLRDQWQSRAHRAEWRRMLRLVQAMAKDRQTEVTALSGEIHLATRATMELGAGRTLHQLVASGVTHRAPPDAWARTLGTLAALGEDPLSGHKVAIRPVPGFRRRYVAERNTLRLDRVAGRWKATWTFERSGESAPLDI